MSLNLARLRRRVGCITLFGFISFIGLISLSGLIGLIYLSGG